MSAKTIMVQGTSSDVGKSIIVTAICRVLHSRGVKTAPFKSQNMSLNSYATKDGFEVGVAQAVQAEACGVAVTHHMNPVLLKPTGNMGSQVVLNGKPFKNMSAKEYMLKKKDFFEVVTCSLSKLIGEYDAVVIEGAGSPAEINLKTYDIVNMSIAEYADSPVILVGDIDRGGVFASLFGTLSLLEPLERERIKGIIINKFRGDISILEPGIKMIEEKTGVNVLGVLPYFKDINILAEDSLSIKNEVKKISENHIKISVVRLPFISNFTDFEIFKREDDLHLNYCENPDDLNGSDIIIIPGSKNTVSDLKFLKTSRFYDRILECKSNGALIVGICGGFQMLGKSITDEKNVESKNKEISGLGFIDMKTVFRDEKTTEQVLAKDFFYNESVKGYEIHMGESFVNYDKFTPMSRLLKRGETDIDILEGAVSFDKSVWGTYIHGLFNNDGFRNKFLDEARVKKGFSPATGIIENADIEYAKLAKHFSKHIDFEKIVEIMGL